MHFDWDEAKNRENTVKHDVSFERAIEIFDDPFALTQSDRFHDEEEERWITLGAIGPGAILFVVHTLQGENTIRIISARAARSRERKAYEKHTKGRQREIAAIVAKSDAAIDLTEMPEVLDWSGAEVGKFYRPAKKPVTLRLDGDVIEWLKSFGPGYQTRANGLLRHAMEASSSLPKRRKSA